ncbi:MAG: Ku protein [Firmicutes bacterium]|nr:Ku protein [Candidatus Fermentithermobacillaceae bacterium]
MRPLWKGVLGFGLVVIPVRIYKATEDKTPSFRLLHLECNTPVRYLKWCPTCNREVASEEIVRGVEYEKGQYVLLTDEDMSKLPEPEPHSVRIMEFCDISEVDPVFFRDAFFLEPQEGAARAYSLLLGAMTESRTVAVARVALRSRETLALVRPYRDKVLALETMYWADEVRSAESLEIPTGVAVAQEEKEMAKSLVKMMKKPFEPEKHVSAYRQRINELVQAKLQGRQVVREPARAPAEVIDLMEALRRSISAAKEEKRGKTVRESAPAPP